MARQHSYAAYAAGDVEDAKRGRPAVSTEPWAASRGLEFMGSSLPGAFSHVMPLWQDYVFNLGRGALSPTRYGYVANELDEIGLDDAGDPRQTGSYHSVRVLDTKVGGLRGMLRFAAHLEDRRPNEPFAARAFWVPTTTVGVRVEQAALLPVIVIRSAERFPIMGNPELGAHGLPGYRMAGSRWVDDGLRSAVAAAARPLASLGASYAGLRLDRGVLAVHRNGFVVDPGALDEMVAVAVAIAEGLAQVAQPLLSPQAFTTPLPAPDPASWPPGYDQPQDHEADVLDRVSLELGMVREDPVWFHRAHPSCPVPGRALGVVRGCLPGTTAEGRVGFFVQGGRTSGTYRSAVMVPALPGATTALGGVLDPTSDLYVEVADGIAYGWPRVRSVGALNAAATVAAALEALRRLQLTA